MFQKLDLEKDPTDGWSGWQRRRGVALPEMLQVYKYNKLFLGIKMTHMIFFYFFLITKIPPPNV